MENDHYNSYREHQLGQPIRGDLSSVENLNADVLNDFRAANFFGDNIVIVGTGSVNHEQFVDQVNSAFNTIAQKTSQPTVGVEKAVYGPALMMIRDDDMYNSNVGVFYDAPSIKHPDYYSFLLLKSMLGSYRIDKHATHLNDTQKQYNALHTQLGDLVDVTKQDCHYFAYSDCGLFGNYFFGNEVFTRQMNYCGVNLLTNYAQYVNDVEIYRGRNHLYNSMMNAQHHSDIADEVGLQMLTVGRRVTRSEIATRVAPMDAYHIKHLANEYFWDAEPSFTNWGPIEQTSSIGSYKYFKVNTMNSILDTHHSLHS